MDRRHFLERTSTVLAGAVLTPNPLASGESRPDPSAPGGRLVLPMNRGWRFSRTVVPNGHGRAFDDSSFERVVVPHTNARLPWHGFGEKASQFVSLYRRRFRLPREARGRHVFVDFEGVMTASTVWINGERLGEYRGGYTPFSFELTPHLDCDGENVLAVEVDSTERADIPPFGYEIDYLTFGGIYREVALRVVPGTFIENVFAKPRDVLTARPGLDVVCFLQSLEPSRRTLTLEVELREGGQTLARATRRVPPSAATGEPVAHSVRLDRLGRVKPWDLAQPQLYEVRVRLLDGARLLDEDSRRTGFRDARFTDHGFELNGKVVKLRGLNRHQTYPFVGQAMPARVQRRDAQILRRELSCNIVRTSHYPAVAALPRRLRRARAAGAGGDPRLAAHRRRGLEGALGRQRAPDDPARLEPPVDRAVGRAGQRVEGLPRPLRPHQRAGPRARSDAPDRRHPLPPGVGAAGGRLHHERLRLPAEATQPPALPEHGVRRPYVSDQDDRQRGAARRAHAASRAHPRPAGFRPAVRRGSRLVRVRLQHPRRLRLRRPRLLPRRERHLPRAEARGGLLQVAVRSRRAGRARARLPLGARRRVRRASRKRWSRRTATS